MAEDFKLSGANKPKRNSFAGGSIDVDEDIDPASLGSAKTTSAEAKGALKAEYGTANLKKIEKIRAREALADAAKLGRKAEEQEARLNDPRFMAQKMAEARRAAVADLSRAPTGGQQAELARAALGGGDARRVAEVARQSSRGQAEATAQAAAQQGFQAGQAAAQAERAMLDQLRQRQDALLATAGEPPTTFAEETGQALVSQSAEFAASEGLSGALEAMGVETTRQMNADAIAAGGQAPGEPA